MTTPEPEKHIHRGRRPYFPKEERYVWVGAFVVPERLAMKVLSMLEKRQEESTRRNTQTTARPKR